MLLGSEHAHARGRYEHAFAAAPRAELVLEVIRAGYKIGSAVCRVGADEAAPAQYWALIRRATHGSNERAARAGLVRV